MKSGRLFERIAGRIHLIGSWGAFALIGLLAQPSAAFAQRGQPADWQRTMQEPVSPVAHGMVWLHDFVNAIIVAITAFVLILLAIVVFRFNERRHPTPSRITHNTLLEVMWTVIPVVILVVIAIPSFKLLYYQYSYPKPDLTIKAVANAWFWEHQYPDNGGFTIATNILRDDDVLKAELGTEEFNRRYRGLEGIELLTRLYADAAPIRAKNNQPRQLAVDNEIAVPVNKVVHVLITSNDVIHNWTIPSFGSKVDAVPGRVTATWFEAQQTGIYYGQCSELCGRDHAYMPFAVRVVSEQAFNAWADALKSAGAERDAARKREFLNRAKEVLRTAAREDQEKSRKVAAVGEKAN